MVWLRFLKIIYFSLSNWFIYVELVMILLNLGLLSFFGSEKDKMSCVVVMFILR